MTTADDRHDGLPTSDEHTSTGRPHVDEATHFQPPAFSPTAASGRPTTTGRAGGKVAWALTAVFVAVAAAFAVLWVAKSGDADDLTNERDRLTAHISELEGRLSSTEEELATATEQVQSTNAELDSAKDDAAQLEAQVAKLDAQVANLTGQLDRPALSDEIAFGFGSDIGASAQPPLTQVEATCLGRELYGSLDFDTLLTFSYDQSPADSQLTKLLSAMTAATAACGLDLGRLGAWTT